VQHFHHEDEEHRGQRVPLPETIGMAYLVTRTVVEQYLGTRHRQQGGHLVPLGQSEPHVL
jgi:hypothetical protein